MERLLPLFSIRERLPVVAFARIIVSVLMVGFFSMGLETWAYGENYIQRLELGRVDWTNGVVEASATGTPPEHACSPAQGRALAETEARTSALNHLIGLLHSIRIDSRSTVKEALEHRASMDGLVAVVFRDSCTAENSPLADGAVRVTMAIRLNGAFADLVLPKTIVAIKTVEQSEKKDEKFTGLIVDCRGLPLTPAMVPVITGEDGQVVYGTAYVSRDHAMEEGMGAYARGLADARKNPRVGSNPLIVKGLRTVKPRSCDVVISNADAAKIKGAGSNIGFLHKGRVLFVMD